MIKLYKIIIHKCYKVIKLINIRNTYIIITPKTFLKVVIIKQIYIFHKYSEY